MKATNQRRTKWLLSANTGKRIRECWRALRLG
ncbi:hypothetical protein [Enterobacter phage N5822]|nr:hypothetical protein [Enterobacter phage N5822]